MVAASTSAHISVNTPPGIVEICELPDVKLKNWTLDTTLSKAARAPLQRATANFFTANKPLARLRSSVPAEELLSVHKLLQYDKPVLVSLNAADAMGPGIKDSTNSTSIQLCTRGSYCASTFGRNLRHQWHFSQQSCLQTSAWHAHACPCHVLGSNASSPRQPHTCSRAC